MIDWITGCEWGGGQRQRIPNFFSEDGKNGYGVCQRTWGLPELQFELRGQWLKQITQTLVELKF